MKQDINTNPNYTIQYGFSGDEDKDNYEIDNNDFTNVEMPGDEPAVGDENPQVEEEKDEGISFGLESDEEDGVEGTEDVDTEDTEITEGAEDVGGGVAEAFRPPQEQDDSTTSEDGNLKVSATPESAEIQEVSAGQAAVIKKILDRITDEIEQIKKILPGADVEISDKLSTEPEADIETEDGRKIVEGVFDGEGMVGSDGKQYDVPANYASKSKLVEGDILKLTINPDGSFLFKQIGPSERNRIVGTLAYDPIQGRYLVVADNKKWYILTASVTYFKGKPGDEAVILVPKNTPSKWAAVENIIGKKEIRGGE